MDILYNTIFLNGKPLNCSTNISLYDLLLHYGFNIDTIVVEYNQKVIPSDRFSKVFLKAEDNIEVITIVGGG